MVRDTFASLRDALAADDPAEVDAVFGRLGDEMAVQRAREEGYVKQARAARGSREVGDAATAAALALQQQVGEVVAARGRVFTAVDNYLTGNLSAEEAAATVDGQLDRFDDLEQAAESFQAETENETLPPVLVLTGLETLAVPKGGAVEEQVTVRNVGGTELSDVSLSVETDPEVDLSLSRDAVGSLSPDESATVSLSGTPSRDSEVRITATSGDLADGIDAALNVRDVREIVGDGLTDVFEILKRLRAALSDAADESKDGANGGKGGGKGNRKGGGPEQGYEAKLEAVTKSLAKAFDRIEDGDPEGSVHGKFDAAIEQTEAFVNHVEAQSGKQLPARAATQLVTDARALVATIEEAKAAER